MEVSKFLKFAANWLKLGKEVPKVTLSYDEEEAQRMKSFGKFTPDINELRVVAVNRNLADILRTIAHELVHNKQKKDGALNPKSNKTGSSSENDANAIAGVIMREYGQLNPIIFE